MAPSDAIIESVRNRTRPIFMTTVTTLLGLAPLVLFPGAGSELYRGLGAVVLGGLLVSTVFTLILVPTLLRIAFALFGAGEVLPAEEPEEDAGEHPFDQPPAPRQPVAKFASTGA